MPRGPHMRVKGHSTHQHVAHQTDCPPMMRRTTATIAATLLLAVTIVVNPATAQGADAKTSRSSFSPEDEVAYVANINEIRAANGVGPLTINVNMTNAARSWTTWMVDNTTLAHADDIVTGAPSNWLKVGENVGRGGTLDAIWEAFLASPGHRANIMDPAYDLVGIGVIWNADGRMYTTHRFAAIEAAKPITTPVVNKQEPEAPPPAEQAVAPASDQLPFADPPARAPAESARLTITMTLLLDAD